MVNGAIRPTDISGHYYFSEHEVTENSLDAVHDLTRLNVLEQAPIEYEVIKYVATKPITLYLRP